jgi:hypothetical protein
MRAGSGSGCFPGWPSCYGRRPGWSALAVVINEVQWADSESLDVLTLLIRVIRADSPSSA